MSESGSGEGEPVYAVRLTPRADQEIIEEFVRLGETQGADLARQWLAGLRESAGTLAQMPGRYAILSDESRWTGQQVRRIQYRRTSGSAMYFLLYVALRDSDDGPQVLVLHLRHSAMKPLTEEEVRAWKSDL